MSKTSVLWFTGLSGAGKSTIAVGLMERLEWEGKTVKIIDGDEIRKVRKDLTFEPKDIKRNTRQVTQMCLDLTGKYDYLIVSVITPYCESRAYSRAALGDCFTEVFIKASLNAVIKRDIKGLYKKALNGEIENFIGISENTPYEEPEHAEVIIDTEDLSVDEAILKLHAYVNKEIMSHP